MGFLPSWATFCLTGWVRVVLGSLRSFQLLKATLLLLMIKTWQVKHFAASRECNNTKLSPSTKSQSSFFLRPLGFEPEPGYIAHWLLSWHDTLHSPSAAFHTGSHSPRPGNPPLIWVPSPDSNYGVYLLSSWLFILFKMRSSFTSISKIVVHQTWSFKFRKNLMSSSHSTSWQIISTCKLCMGQKLETCRSEKHLTVDFSVYFF